MSKLDGKETQLNQAESVEDDNPLINQQASILAALLAPFHARLDMLEISIS
jgi:hypothetical protein